MIGKKKITDKIKEDLKFQKIAKKQKFQEAGITLIALVVTIIILLILAGVTLNIALSDNGLIKKSQEATEEYKQAEEDERVGIKKLENKMIEELGDTEEINYNDYIGTYVEGYKPNEKTSSNPFKIDGNTSGTGEEQTFTTDTDMQWKIWDYDGTTLRLISEKPTKEKLTLTNVSGYNNGVYAINKICSECYSNGKTGVEVANLRRSDIQKVSNYDYTSYKHESDSANEFTGETSTKEIIQYGEAKTCHHINAPLMWSQHDSNWTYSYDNNQGGTGENEDGVDPWEKDFGFVNETGKGETTASTLFKQSHYKHNYYNKQEEFEDSIYYDLIFRNCALE